MPSLPENPVDRALELAGAEAPVVAVVTRSGRTESWHRATVAVWHEPGPAAGAPLLELGCATAPVFCRSAVKPLQALPLFERGIVDRLGLARRELAVVCASHDGTPEHVAAVRALLRRAGLDEDQLRCGPHAPFDPDARRALLAAGRQPLRVHNNCSGKHAGFLCLARDCGDDPAAYLDPASRAQGLVAAAVAGMAGVEGPVPTGVDGCGAPTFVLPLRGLARAFARLANPVGLPDVRAAACRSILEVAGREPVLVAGERRLCTALLRSAPGALFAKNGAEGVYAVGLAPDPARPACPGGVGLAIKVHDGAERAYQPVVIDLLRRLGTWSGAVPKGLEAFATPAVRNTRGEVVGAVRVAVEWPL